MACIGVKISSKLFTYSPAYHLFTAEASTLSAVGNVTGRLYDDAYDAGFVMVGERTGCDVVFYLHRYEYSGGEMIGMEFLPATESKRKYPACSIFRVYIFND